MAETSKRDLRREWISRILMTIDIILIAWGYIAWFQTKDQLDSPLIPRTTVYEVLLHSGEDIIKTSLISIGIFLTGLWLYFFQKKSLANIFFLAIIVYFLLFIIVPEIVN